MADSSTLTQPTPEDQGSELQPLPSATPTTTTTTATTTTTKEGIVTKTTAAAETGTIAAGTRFRIRARHWVFKLGVIMLFVSTVMFVVGFSVPAWVNVFYDMGLWITCPKNRPCHGNIVGPDMEWLTAAQNTATVALLCFVAALIAELYQDVLNSPPPPDNMAVEIFAGTAGLMGLSSVVIFLVGFLWLADDSRDNFPTFLWGHFVTAAGSFLGLASAGLIAFSRVKHRTFTTQALAGPDISVSTSV